MSETDEARVRHYVEAMEPRRLRRRQAEERTRTVAVRRKIATDHARAAIAVADEEQAALRAEMVQLLARVERITDGWRETNRECIKHWNRADAAEAEVERLTRECLDREATETDARERLRRCEERLAAMEALHVKSSDGLRCLGCLFIWPCPTISELR